VVNVYRAIRRHMS